MASVVAKVAGLGCQILKTGLGDCCELVDGDVLPMVQVGRTHRSYGSLAGSFASNSADALAIHNDL